MDFNISNFPEGVNVTLTRGIDSLEWFTGTQPKGKFIIPSLGNTRYIDITSIDTSQVTSFSQYGSDAFNFDIYWNKPDENELVFDMSNAEYINYLKLSIINQPSDFTIRFTNCDKLIAIDTILSHYPPKKMIIEGSTTGFTGAFYYRLFAQMPTELYFNIDCSKLKTNSNIAYSSYATGIRYFSGLPNLKNSQTGSNGINLLSNLTYESCISIMENLYDFTGNGETPTSSQGKLKVHSNFLNRVGDEISIATSRGWTITT